MVEELGNSLSGMLLEVKVVLAPDGRSKGVLKTGITGSSIVKVLGIVFEPTVISGGALVIVGGTNKPPDGLVDRVIGVLITAADVTGMSDASVDSTLVTAVVTGRPNTSAGALETTVKVEVVKCGSTARGLGTVLGTDLFISIALVASIIALCTLSLKLSAQNFIIIYCLITFL